MKRRRVKITGIGPVTPAGIGRDEFWKGILEPVSRVAPCKKLDDQAGEFVAAEIKGFKLANIVELEWTRNISRMSQFAVAGTVLALRDAGIGLDEIATMDPVVSVGNALMDPQSVMGTIMDVHKKGPRFARVRAVREAIGSATNAAIVHTLGIEAQVMSFQTACCAGLDAVGFGADMISRGEASLVIAGGTETPVFLHPMIEIRAAGMAPATHENAPGLGRPFDLWRTTGVIGEGACFFILEPEESPRPGYAYVNGFGYASDNNGDLCGGLLRAMKVALANANLSPEHVDCISAWGPGHREIDAAESAVLKEVFGGSLGLIPAYSIKGAIGNPFAAAGPIMLACAALGLRHGIVPPTVNWQRPDPACPLNLSKVARWLKCNRVMIDAHGVSGTNSCMIVERC